ncbi:MAG: O-antigen ligase family protein [Acidobacteriota bacterium]
MLSGLLAGYLFLLIFRPYEYWPILGTFRIERIYVIAFLLFVLVSKEKRWIQSPINVCVGAFVVVLMVSGTLAFNMEESWSLIIDYLKYVVFYALVILTIRDTVSLKNVLLAYLAVMFLYVWKSAWEFFVHGRFIYTMGIKRMIGVDVTYGDPNSFAASICYSLPLLWAMLRYNFENKWLKIGFWCYGALAVVAIAFTGSRSGMAALVLFLVVAGIGSSRKVIGVLFMALLMFLGWDFLPEDLQTRFFSTVESGHGPASADESAAGRLAGFLQGLDVFAKYPILGIGPANFQFSWPGLPRGHNAHNVFGQILGELGIVGTMTFAFLIMTVFLTNRRIVARARRLFPGCDQNIPKPPKSAGLLRKKRRSDLSSQTGAPPGTKGIGGSVSSNAMQNVRLLVFVARAVNMTMMLMIFKGWADHNLYRYTWLWLAAITVLNDHFIRQEIRRYGKA